MKRSYASAVTAKLTRGLYPADPQPAAIVLDQLTSYHFRVLDPRVFAILSATRDAVTIGHCYHI
jgi:hypothetical protein